MIKKIIKLESDEQALSEFSVCERKRERGGRRPVLSQSKTNIESFLPGVHAEEAEELQKVTAVRKLCLWILSSPGSKDHAVV